MARKTKLKLHSHAALGCSSFHYTSLTVDSSENQETYVVIRMTPQTFKTRTFVLVCPSQTAAQYKPGKRPLECTRLAWGAGMSSHSSLSWNSGPHTCYTTKSHVGLVLPLGSHTLSWPRFVWWLFQVTTTSQARKGWGAGQATGKHNLEALHVWITAPKLHGPSSGYKLSCFLSRMKQSLKEVSKPGYWEATAQRKQNSYG